MTGYLWPDRKSLMKNRLEKELMLYCATTHLDERKTSEIRRILDQNIDWDYILALHPLACITPLLFYNLKKIVGRNTIPKSVVDRLRARYVGVLRNNTLIYRQLHEVLEELQNEGIPVILLKGAALAETVYPDIALRPMSDIDLLAKKTDLHDVGEVLSKLGYTQSCPIEYYEKHHHLAPYVKVDAEQRDSVAIEVHHNLIPGPLMSGIDTDRLWEGAQTVKMSGSDALILSSESLILHLCLHLSSSGFVSGMRTLTDISESIRYYGKRLDWHSLIRKSNEFRVGSCVYYSLDLAKEMMYIDIPTYALDGLNLEPKLEPLETRLMEIIARSNILKDWYNSSRSSRFIIFLYNSLCKEFLCTSGLGNRIRNFGMSWLRALDRAYHRYIRKDYVPQVARW